VQISFQDLVDSLCLPICLGVEKDNNFTFTPKTSKEFFPKLGCKLRSMIKNGVFREVVIPKNMIKK